jgi:hypothetical protein
LELRIRSEAWSIISQSGYTLTDSSVCKPNACLEQFGE